MPERRSSGFDSNLRLYAQLQPDAASLAHLLSLRQAVSAPARPVPRHQLHLTLIHFGKVLDVYRIISAQTGIELPAYKQLLSGYIARTEKLLPMDSFRLEPAGLAGFGARGTTLVVEYLPSPEITALHRELYAVLAGFLADCGVADTVGFMASDPNFMFASQLRPHITLARGFSGALPALPLETVTLKPMPVMYPLD
ncbi:MULTISPECIES: 2'-5' RNA ligase family protein [unclassified Arthrobacter]|uniref:2'-5' RNA ligase family protein n=1 Tax=unclassified Arthrobacter TaxID=235627 RepID=UPI001E432362|nr:MULTISPECIES: 2'-5' RNA ligase family protein [unclassified Arthrobacter]MCC9145715.1 2'-5' RNA ligase family protein [Arthrobacter sp. zg-Y919]MDK1276944.1 2'-5' RNA ligase family protein [Arthrobacter sp. zg.Y919]WIB04125.1 2'-5' RNA ligase family protein [Arthrobacter sp. zg-Y919]